MRLYRGRGILSNLPENKTGEMGGIRSQGTRFRARTFTKGRRLPHCVAGANSAMLHGAKAILGQAADRFGHKKFHCPSGLLAYPAIQPSRKGQTNMLTRREFTLVLLTALTTVGLAVQAQSDKTSAMTSTAIEWNSTEVKTNATGSSRKFFEGPTATLDVLECHASTLDPGATNHVILQRPNDEVIIVKEGTIEAFVKDKWVRVGPGSVIFNAANVPQSMRNVGDGPATYHVITFHPPATTPKPAAEKQN